MARKDSNDENEDGVNPGRGRSEEVHELSPAMMARMKTLRLRQGKSGLPFPGANHGTDPVFAHEAEHLITPVGVTGLPYPMARESGKPEPGSPLVIVFPEGDVKEGAALYKNMPVPAMMTAFMESVRPDGYKIDATKLLGDASWGKTYGFKTLRDRGLLDPPKK